MIWQKVLGIPVWNYFFDEGNWGNDGVSFSLIQASEHRRLREAGCAGHHGHLLRDRRPPLPLDAGHRHPADLRGVLRCRPGGERQGRRRLVRRARHHRLGHRDRSGRRLDSGDGDLGVRATPPACRSPRATAYSLPISDQVTYITYPVGDTLTVGPTEDYGRTWRCCRRGPRPPPAPATPRPPSTGCRSATTRAGARARGRHTEPDRHAGRPAHHQSHRGRHPVGREHGHRGAQLHVLGRRAVAAAGPPWPPSSASTGPTKLQLDFDPVAATAVRITVSEVDFGGYYGGGIPPWWSPNLWAPPSSMPSRSTPGPTRPAPSTAPAWPR